MQAIILAAGKGSRLGSLTAENTKCMLEVCGEKLIDISLKKLSAVGISKVILVVGYQKDNLMNYLGSKVHGIDIIYIENPIYDKTNNIYSLYLAKDHLKTDDTLLLESDLIYDQKILEGLLKDPRPSLAVVDKYQSWMDGTVVTLDDNNKITSFVPKKFFNYSYIDSYYKTVNIYKFSKEFSQSTYVPFLEAYSKALGNNEYYEQVLRVVLELEKQELEGYPLQGENWYEIDDIQDKDNAEVIFAITPQEKLQLIQKRYGGFWRYPKLIDFCYLVNPYFPNKVFLDECKTNFNQLLSEYPSGASVQSLLASKLFNVDQNSILVGNGAAELIKALGDVYEGTFGIMQPTFYEYIDAIGADRIKSLVTQNDGFTYTKEELISLGKTVDNLILVNPDNPSGHLLTKNDVLDILNALSNDNKKFIIDESFLDFAENGFEQSLINTDLLEKYKNLVIIKSISKSYGVPGARLGVIITYDFERIKAMSKCLSIWNINSFGEFFLQIIGKYKDSYKSACKTIINERNRFFAELSKISFIKVYKSEANYFLVKILDKYS
ncbi:aminotransferase class I/II-fold pyridoxal phosphate-dependent enzyme, partial [Acinetobacter indicus]|uniref:aminotransferase class I/II-fold pyridoxal phosphate-dependent enzyme n=1 Tax=Acinetobacter indicus TaxID=756892 RepID=UPI000CEC0D81